MSVMAKWGSKRWQITSDTINPIDALSYSMSYDTDAGTKGKRTVTIPYSAYKEFGVDIDEEIISWYTFLGVENPLYIGSKRFGPKTLKLKSVDISDIMVTDTGVVRSATFSLGFEEP